MSGLFYCLKLDGHELAKTSLAPPLKNYEVQEYEQEVLKALRHRFGDALQTETLFRSDAVIQVGSKRIAVEVKHSIAGTRMLEKTGEHLQQVMRMENATGGVIVTLPKSLNTGLQGLQGLAKNGVHLIEWEPSRSSYALYDGIKRTLGDNEA